MQNGFLWWPDSNLTKEPVDYCMTVHLFGGASSPGCSNFALKCTVDDHKEEFGSVSLTLSNVLCFFIFVIFFSLVLQGLWLPLRVMQYRTQLSERSPFTSEVAGSILSENFPDVTRAQSSTNVK